MSTTIDAIQNTHISAEIFVDNLVIEVKRKEITSTQRRICIENDLHIPIGITYRVIVYRPENFQAVVISIGSSLRLIR